MDHCRRCKNRGSSKAPTPIATHTRIFVCTMQNYRCQIPKNVQNTINEVSVEAQFEHPFILDEEIYREFESCIEDPCQTRSKVSLLQCKMHSFGPINPLSIRLSLNMERPTMKSCSNNFPSLSKSFQFLFKSFQLHRVVLYVFFVQIYHHKVCYLILLFSYPS